MSALSKCRAGPARAGLTRIDLVVLLAVALLLLALAVPTIAASRRRELGERSSSHLAKVGLAVLSYADEQRYFPHVARSTVLDGGVESDTAARCLRALVFLGYETDPSVFVSPESEDVAAPFPSDRKAFSWRPGVSESLEGSASPIARPGRGDAPLPELETLSYAWTRAGLNMGNMSSRVVAGDRARRVSDEPEGSLGHTGHMAGNGRDAFGVVCLDAHTERIPPVGGRFSTRRVPLAGEPPSLFGTSTYEDGFLGALGDDE